MTDCVLWKVCENRHIL